MKFSESSSSARWSWASAPFISPVRASTLPSSWCAARREVSNARLAAPLNGQVAAVFFLRRPAARHPAYSAMPSPKLVRVVARTPRFAIGPYLDAASEIAVVLGRFALPTQVSL